MNASDPTITAASADPEPSADASGFAVLRAAIPYIAAHRDRTIVVAMGGEAALSPGFPRLLTEIAELSALGLHIVLVHGARPQISARLAERGVQQRYHQGLRVTNAEALDAVCDAIGRLRLDIESGLSRSLGSSNGVAGVDRHGLASAAHRAGSTRNTRHRVRVAAGNVVTARPIGVRDGVDFLFTGTVRSVDADGLRRLLDDDRIVIASSLGFSPTGERFNLSAEEVATQIAIAIDADKLVFLTATDALRQPQRALPAQMTIPEVEQRLTQQDTAPLPEELAAHLASARDALAVRDMRVHLVDRDEPFALLRELFTREGSGTLVSREAIERLRRATLDDVSGIHALIAPLEAEGILVARPRERLELEIEHFRVLDLDGLIVATAAIYPFPEARTAELACLALHPDYRGAGRGDRLLAQIAHEARKLGCDALFVLTTHTGQWFQERGFEAVDPGALPAARQARLSLQRNSRVLRLPLA